MTCILIGWELGAGRGHLAVIAPVARRLQARGLRVVLALREPAAARDLDLAGCRVVQAPVALGPHVVVEGAPAVSTQADLLEQLGLASPERLGAQVDAWRALLAETRAEAVACEFAPGLAIAAGGVLPVVTLGSGYVCPPAGGSLPSLRPWSPDIPASSRAAEARLEQAVVEVRRRFGLSAPARLADLLHGDKQVVCTWPELDPYAAHRPAPAGGPPERVTPPAPSQEPRDGPAFLYLAATRELPSVLDAVAASGVAAHGHVRGLDAEGRRSLARPGLVLHAAPQPLPEVLARCPLVVHHGGIGATEAALAAGTPQIVLARHLEQVVNGVAIERGLRVGKAFHMETARDRPAVLSDFVARMASSEVVRGRAANFARDLAARPGPDAADRVVETLLRLL